MLSLVIALAGLGCKEKAPSGNSPVSESGPGDVGRWSLHLVNEINADFKVPESVVVLPDSDAIFISNVQTDNEGYWEKDSTGFITRAQTDGTITALRWIDSSPEFLLHGPKGLAIMSWQAVFQ